MKPHLEEWRVGRKVGRTIYRQRSADPADGDELIGVMDTIDAAKLAAQAPLLARLLLEVLQDYAPVTDGPRKQLAERIRLVLRDTAVLP